MCVCVEYMYSICICTYSIYQPPSDGFENGTWGGAVRFNNTCENWDLTFLKILHLKGDLIVYTMSDFVGKCMATTFFFYKWWVFSRIHKHSPEGDRLVTENCKRKAGLTLPHTPQRLSLPLGNSSQSVRKRGGYGSTFPPAPFQFPKRSAVLVYIAAVEGAWAAWVSFSQLHHNVWSRQGR